MKITMKTTCAIMAFIIFSAASTRLLALDFLDDPFFKQLASELDTMFGQTKEEAPLATKKPSQAASSQAKSFTPKGNLKDDKAATPVVADAAKDLKTLFTESLVGAKPASGPSSYGGSSYGGNKQAAKITISARKKQAYHHYMDDFVKKIRLLERITASNPGRTFGPAFLVGFDGVIDVIDQIEASSHLINSKKMYLRTFFGQPLQKTREQIVVILPKLDSALKRLRPLLQKEESLDDDISRLNREAKKSAIKTRSITPSTTKSKKTAIQSKKIPHTPTTPHYSKLKKLQPNSKDLPPATLPADFSLRDFMKKGSTL